MEDGLTVGGILLIVEGDDNLCGIAEMFGRGVPGEKKYPGKERKLHEGPELDCLEVASALCLFAGKEASVEANYDQGGNVVGSGIGGVGCRDND